MKMSLVFKAAIMVSIIAAVTMCVAVICGLTNDTLESHLSGNSSIEEIDNQITTTATTTTVITTNEDNHTSSTE